ncbi:hypothetical protein M8J77_002600 [Diaphorina citri]|nr:hypothetical protein M8J77_002600 [Diaphorina citri]
MSSPRVIVVTGASVGIGSAILRQQASLGHIVVGLARRAEKIEEIKKENKDWNVHALKVDLSQEKEIVEAFNWIKTNLKKVDVLVNNAAVLIATDVLKGEMEHWRTMFDVNLFAPGICVREVNPILAEDGHIVNISSVAGQSIIKINDYLIYASTKHALKVVTEATRMALAQEKPKVRVTIISPGVVATDMSVGFREAAPVEIPAVTPEDVANSVNYVINTPYHCNVTELTVRPTSEVI